MEIVVRGKNVKVESSVQAVTREKLAKLARFAQDVGRVEVDFSEIRNPRVADRQVCEVTVHLKRHFVKAHAAATEPVAALDLTIDKVEHQVARLKEKRIGRSHPRRRRLAANPPQLEAWEPQAVGAGETPGNGTAEHAEIIRTKRFAAMPMDVDEAALQMDLLGHDFYLFHNSENGNAAVLYRRHDGHLGLIEAVG